MAKKKTSKKSNQRQSILKGEVIVGALILAGFFLIKLNTSFHNFSTSPLDLKEILPTPALYPKIINNIPLPILTAKSIIILDVDSGTILLDKEGKVATHPASITKIMTALVALENYSLGQILEVPEVSNIEGQKIKLVDGERMSVENLLYGLLVASGNDTAVTLAKNFPGGQEGFIWAMNQKAEELELTNTHFINEVGYDGEGHYSTALDLSKLSLEAMKNEKFAQIVRTEKITITDEEGNHVYKLSNINTLLGKLPGVKGVKTGWTQEAGECLVTYIEQNNHRLIISLLGSQNRFGETEELLTWVLANFEWEEPLP